MNNSFRNLEVYKRSGTFAEKIFTLIKVSPELEKYNIINQINRSSTSIFLNLSEGLGRNHNKDKMQFFFIVRESCYETISLLEICVDRKYLSKESFEEFIGEIEVILKMINALIRRMKN